MHDAWPWICEYLQQLDQYGNHTCWHSVASMRSLGQSNLHLDNSFWQVSVALPGHCWRLVLTQGQQEMIVYDQWHFIKYHSRRITLAWFYLLLEEGCTLYLENIIIWLEYFLNHSRIVHVPANCLSSRKVICANLTLNKTCRSTPVAEKKKQLKNV